MLNLLNVVFVIFYGYYSIDDRHVNYNLQALPLITYVENTNDDDYSIDLIIDTNYFLTIDSTDFEDDTGYSDKFVYTSNSIFTFDGFTIPMVENLSLYFEFYDFKLSYGVKNNSSYIDMFFYEYIEIDLLDADFSNTVYNREEYKHIHIDTDFTIYNNFEVYDYTNFHIEFRYEFIDTYEDGYEVGYEDGYDNGFGNGEEYGYEQGYKQGSNDLDKVFNGSWVEWLGTSITGFFALEIFPGFTLAGALGAVLCAYIMMWILKVLAGG